MDNEGAKNGLRLGQKEGAQRIRKREACEARSTLRDRRTDLLSKHYRRPEGRLHSNRVEYRYKRVNVANGGHCTCSAANEKWEAEDRSAFLYVLVKSMFFLQFRRNEIDIGEKFEKIEFTISLK